MPASDTSLTFLSDFYANSLGLDAQALLWALSSRRAGVMTGVQDSAPQGGWCPAPPVWRHGEGRGQ